MDLYRGGRGDGGLSDGISAQRLAPTVNTDC